MLVSLHFFCCRALLLTLASWAAASGDDDEPSTRLHKSLGSDALQVVCHIKRIADLARKDTPTYILNRIREREASALHAVGRVKHYIDQVNAIIAMRKGTPDGEKTEPLMTKIYQLCGEAEAAANSASSTVGKARAKAETAAGNVMKHAAEVSGSPQDRTTDGTGLRQLLDWHCKGNVRIPTEFECVSYGPSSSSSDGSSGSTVDCTQRRPDVNYKTLDSAKMKAAMEKWVSVKPPASETVSTGCRNYNTNEYLCAELEKWVPSYRRLTEGMLALEQALREVSFVAGAVERQWTIAYHLYNEVEKNHDFESLSQVVNKKKHEIEATRNSTEDMEFLHRNGSFDDGLTDLSGCEGEENVGGNGDSTEGGPQSKEAAEALKKSQRSKKIIVFVTVGLVSLAVAVSIVAAFLCVCRRRRLRESAAHTGEVSKECAEPSVKK